MSTPTLPSPGLPRREAAPRGPAPWRWRGCQALLLAWACALLAGCAGVKVSSVAPRDYLAQRRADILTTGQLSPSAQEVLRVIGTEPRWCARDGAACRQAIASSGGLSDEQRLSALAEIWLQAALALDQPSTAAAAQASDVDNKTDAWLETARHAYAYLFFTARSPGERAFEDRQTQVRDYYNFAVQQVSTLLFLRHQRALSNAVAPAQDAGLPRIGDWILDYDASQVQMPDQQMPMALIPASSLTFSGLRNIYRRDGFGAELVAVSPLAVEQWQGTRPFREMPYPAITVLIGFEGSNLREVMDTRHIRITLLDPYRSASARLAGLELPVAANFTSGYGLWLARSDFATQSLRTLLGRDNGLTRPQVYLMQPYDPERRVIVMLHGLASSPEAWINVANEVLGDEQLRLHYQIWQVYYPTNAPLALNNHAIRQALAETFRHVDPAGSAPASRDVTLVGHSMGGVLARLMVSSSDGSLTSALLAEYAPRPDEFDEVRTALAHYLDFSPVPGVSSAIFIAAPHRGTPFAHNRIARWIANLVTLPAAMLEQIDEVTRAVARLRPRDPASATVRIPNSIDNLSDRDTFVRLAATLPISPHVRYHSIIGDDTPGLPLMQSSDGIVPYASAHLEGAASELVVRSSHSVQESAHAILEIRRILKEQLGPP